MVMGLGAGKALKLKGKSSEGFEGSFSTTISTERVSDAANPDESVASGYARNSRFSLLSNEIEDWEGLKRESQNHRGDARVIRASRPPDTWGCRAPLNREPGRGREPAISGGRRKLESADEDARADRWEARRPFAPRGLRVRIR